VQNPHPLLVHFPIAFLVAFAGGALLSLVLPHPGIERFARTCLFVGTAAAAVVVVSGFLAEQSVARVAAAAEPIAEHRLFGYGTLITAAALTALAVIAPRHPARAGALKMIQGAGAVVVLALLFLTAHEGGELVHEFGVGTALTAPGGPLHETGGGRDSAAPRTPGDAPAPSGKDFR